MSYEPVYFTDEETKCRCGCGLSVKEQLYVSLDKVRRACGGPLYVTSGARCSRYNARVGGAKASYHTKGLACDIVWPAGRQHRLIAALLKNGFNGIGIYEGFIHADLRETPAFWVG